MRRSPGGPGLPTTLTSNRVSLPASQRRTSNLGPPHAGLPPRTSPCRASPRRTPVLDLPTPNRLNQNSPTRTSQARLSHAPYRPTDGQPRGTLPCPPSPSSPSPSPSTFRLPRSGVQHALGSAFGRTRSAGSPSCPSCPLPPCLRERPPRPGPSRERRAARCRYMLALAPRPPPVLRRSPGRSLRPWPPGAVRALHPTPRTSGPRARPRPREYAPPRVRTPLRPTRPASNPSEPPRMSLPSSALQDRGSASVAPLRTTPHARQGGPERACPAFSPSSCPPELQERLQLFKSAAIFTAANFPACLALRERELGPTGNGGRGRRDGWDLWGR